MGSGKSSIINVLMRFYEFQSGQSSPDGGYHSQEELRKISVYRTLLWSWTIAHHRHVPAMTVLRQSLWMQILSFDLPLGL